MDGSRLSSDPVVLDGPEGRHAARVKRLTVGERVDVADGAGSRAECVVRSVGKDSLSLDVLRRVVEPEPEPRLVVVQALAKGDRAEAAVAALTEVGVDVIVPWAAARSVVQWRGDRAERALARWAGRAREASKQARRGRVPELTPCATTDEVTGLLASSSRGFVLHEDATRPLASTEVPPRGDLVVVVGPEGGVADDELTAFTAAGGLAVRLGSSVLRTSTAGVAAAAVLLARSGRWS